MCVARGRRCLRFTLQKKKLFGALNYYGQLRDHSCFLFEYAACLTEDAGDFSAIIGTQILYHHLLTSESTCLSSARQGRVSDTSSKTMGPTLQKVLAASSAIQKEFDDSFISVEHLLLALAREDSRFTQQAFRDRGVDYQKLMAAVKDVRGPQKVTTRTPESSYEVSRGTSQFSVHHLEWKLPRKWRRVRFGGGRGRGVGGGG